MKSRLKIIKATKRVAGVILTLGIMTFLYGLFVNGYSMVFGIGLGAVMGAVFIFLMGMFLAATEEMVENTDKGIPVRVHLYRIK